MNVGPPQKRMHRSTENMSLSKRKVKISARGKECNLSSRHAAGSMSYCIFTNVNEQDYADLEFV